MEIEKTVERENLIYRASEYTYSLKTFGRDIYNSEISLKDAHNDQTNFLVEIMALKKNTKPQNQEKINEKRRFLKTCMHFLRVEKKSLMLLKVKYFQ